MPEPHDTEYWLSLRTLPPSTLESMQWHLFDPTRKLPAGLLWDRLLDRITSGAITRDLLRGRYRGGTPAGPQFPLTAIAVAIRPSADALCRRAIDWTLDAGPPDDETEEYRGYDGLGREVYYGYVHAFVDLEVALRRWSPLPLARTVQGVLLGRLIVADVVEATDELRDAALALLANTGSNLPEYWQREASQVADEICGLRDDCRPRG